MEERRTLRKRKILDENDILDLIQQEESDGSDFDDDSIIDPNYAESDCVDSDHCDSDFDDILDVVGKDMNIQDENVQELVVENVQDLDEGNIHELQNENIDIINEQSSIWNSTCNSFVPRKTLPNCEPPVIHANLDRRSSELEVFFKIFPKSLFMKIADCTNKRIDILNQKISNENTRAPSSKKLTVQHTDQYEAMVVVGLYLVMSYNRLPHISMYWSQNSSLGNSAIRNSIGRDRFLMLSSKLYFNDPQKPSNSSKTYYIDEMVSCLNYTFKKCRSDSAIEAIDEAMAKFKGRSAIKQYMPMKPVKRGVKIWERCDSKTGYSYDVKIYSGKEIGQHEGTLGERVVRNLCSTLENSDTIVCCDRFFTSVHLAETLEYGLVGTINKNRKNLPNFGDAKLNRGEYVFKYNGQGCLAVIWQDVKEVIAISNCHKGTVTSVQRKTKDGQKEPVTCPDAIAFYNEYMGGVDLSDQFSSLYDPDRKSGKWWKKVFQKLLMVAVSNSWIIFQEVQHKKIPLIQFLVPLAEQLLAYGRERASIKRRSTTGRPSKRSKNLTGVGEHLPIQIEKRRRCKKCANENRETRTKTICTGCNFALCKNCFAQYHTN